MVLGVAVVCADCSTTVTQVRLAEPRDIAPADGPPHVVAVHDLGAPRLRGTEHLPTDQGDGVAIIGELVLVEGDNFGRLPQVSVDGRAASLVARTGSGGVVARVPWGVRPGNRVVEIRTRQGKGRGTVPVRRYALATVPSRDAVFVLEVNDTIERVGAPLSLPGARRIRYIAEGQIAYVAGLDPKGKLMLASVNMARPGGPQITDRREIPGERLVALTGAERAPLALAMSDSHMVFVDTSDPATPALYSPRPLPDGLAGKVQAADMDPAGKLLAVLMRSDNELRLYRVTSPGDLQLLASAKVLPDAKESLVREARFGPDSRTVWVISGDNADSGRRRHPLRLTVIRISETRKGSASSFGVMSVWRTLAVPYRAAPVDLAVARGQPLASGRTVRVPPKNAAVFITAHASSLLRLRKTRFDRRRGLRRAVRILRGIDPLGTVVRTDIEGRGGPMYSSPSLLGPIDVTSDSQLLLVAGAKVWAQRKPARVRLVYGVSSAHVFGKPRRRFIPLAEVDPAALARPFLLGDVRAQP